MRKESLFKADQQATKKIYQSPAMEMVELSTTAIIAASDMLVDDPWKNTVEEEI